MKKLTKENVSQEVFDLYDKYAHNIIDRREFIEKLSLYAVGGVTVASLMSFIMLWMVIERYLFFARIKLEKSHVEELKNVNSEASEALTNLNQVISETASEIVQRVCDEPLKSGYFIQYLEQKYKTLYKL